MEQLTFDWYVKNKKIEEEPKPVPVYSEPKKIILRKKPKKQLQKTNNKQNFGLPWRINSTDISCGPL